MILLRLIAGQSSGFCWNIHYNRDGKKGKRQIVVGLLCNAQGQPLSIEVFAGHTQDPATMASQIHKVAQRFGGGEVTFVGDRGMIRSRQIEDLTTQGFHYITAITKPQIESLLARGVLTMSLFDTELAEVIPDDGPRYVVRRNSIRATEMKASLQHGCIPRCELSGGSATRYPARRVPADIH